MFSCAHLFFLFSPIPPFPPSLPRVITCSCEIARRDAGASHILVIFHMHFVKRAKARDETRGSLAWHEEALLLDTLSGAARVRQRGTGRDEQLIPRSSNISRRNFAALLRALEAPRSITLRCRPH